MQPWNHEPPPDDMPHDPSIARWFQALGPPPEGPAPPYLYARVRAQFVRQQVQQGLGGWLSRLGIPRWVPVLAAALLVSLGLNVWWGIGAFGPQTPGMPPGSSVQNHDNSPARRLHTARFQSEMQQALALGKFVDAEVPFLSPPIGFVPQTARTTFVRLGTLYAEALATLRSGEVEATTRRLEALRQSLSHVQAPEPLGHYLHTVQAVLASQPPADSGVVTALALFEPLYEDAYVSIKKAEPVLLFQVGAGLQNMVLAATTADAAALQRGVTTLTTIRSTLLALGVPQNSLETLDLLHSLVQQQELSASTIQTIHTLSQQLQKQFGG